MDRIHYAGDSLLTGSEIARALLDYAQALAQAGTAATVDIPTVNEDGVVGRSEILVGPASQLLSSAEEASAEDVVDAALVAQLAEKSENHRRHGHEDTTATVPEDQASPTRKIAGEGKSVEIGEEAGGCRYE